jgi:hypothetical protein
MENNNKLWFRRKRYGWGWTPATKEGWLVLLVYIIIFATADIIFVNSMKVAPSHTKSGVFLAFVGFITGILIQICYKKGEEPRWSWGRGKNEDKKV